MLGMRRRGVRCVGRTAAGKRCRRNTTNANGDCERHGVAGTIAPPRSDAAPNISLSDDGQSLIATVSPKGRQWVVELTGRQRGLRHCRSRQEAIQTAESELISAGGGEVVSNKRLGRGGERYIIAGKAPEAPRVRVYMADDGMARLVIPGHPAKDIIYNDIEQAAQVAREYLVATGGGDLVIEGSNGEVSSEESVPKPEWWIDP